MVHSSTATTYSTLRTHLGHAKYSGDAIHGKDNVAQFNGNHAHEKRRSLLDAVVHANGKESIAVVLAGGRKETRRE